MPRKQCAPLCPRCSIPTVTATPNQTKFESRSVLPVLKYECGTGISGENTRLQYLLDDQRRMSRARNYFAWQARLVRPELGQRVIEVGCGIGNFTGMLLDREAVIALDVEPTYVERVIRRYPNRSNLQTYSFDANSPEFT